MHGRTLDGREWRCPCHLYGSGMEHARVTALKRSIRRRVAVLRLMHGRRLLRQIERGRGANGEG